MLEVHRFVSQRGAECFNVKEKVEKKPKVSHLIRYNGYWYTNEPNNVSHDALTSTFNPQFNVTDSKKRLVGTNE